MLLVAFVVPPITLLPLAVVVSTIFVCRPAARRRRCVIRRRCCAACHPACHHRAAPRCATRCHRHALASPPLSFVAANWLTHLPTTLSPPIDATTASPLAECSLSRRAAASRSRFHGLTLPSPTCWLIVGSCFAFLCCFSKEIHAPSLHPDGSATPVGGDGGAGRGLRVDVAAVAVGSWQRQGKAVKAAVAVGGLSLDDEL